MLMRIFLIVAIVAALGAGVVNFVLVKPKIQALTDDRNSQRDAKVQAQNDLASTKKTLATTQGQLRQTQQDLADAKSAQKKAEDIAATQQKRADDLAGQLAKATADRDDAQGKLAAYTSTGVTADQVAHLAKELKDANDAIAVANDEKLILTRSVTRLQNKLNELLGEDYVIKLRPDLKGKVVVVDPKWDFVVLNIGEDQGVLQDGELLISRDGKLVAKVIVRTVQKDRSIANIIPGWKIGEVFEGDMVTPAHPAS
jgi:multidrug efflux pump subunit AcrA (membrane-fusion protein)